MNGGLCPNHRRMAISLAARDILETRLKTVD